jgi:hypothetical protein
LSMADTVPRPACAILSTHFAPDATWPVAVVPAETPGPFVVTCAVSDVTRNTSVEVLVFLVTGTELLPWLLGFLLAAGGSRSVDAPVEWRRAGGCGSPYWRAIVSR